MAKITYTIYVTAEVQNSLAYTAEHVVDRILAEKFHWLHEAMKAQEDYHTLNGNLKIRKQMLRRFSH